MTLRRRGDHVMRKRISSVRSIRVIMLHIPINLILPMLVWILAIYKTI